MVYSWPKIGKVGVILDKSHQRSLLLAIPRKNDGNLIPEKTEIITTHTSVTSSRETSSSDEGLFGKRLRRKLLMNGCGAFFTLLVVAIYSSSGRVGVTLAKHGHGGGGGYGEGSGGLGGRHGRGGVGGWWGMAMAEDDATENTTATTSIITPTGRPTEASSATFSLPC